MLYIRLVQLLIIVYTIIKHKQTQTAIYCDEFIKKIRQSPCNLQVSIIIYYTIPNR
ncbi:MAG: hypothetical protein ACI8P3_001678 [Saprospiraceae bacterium]|jgi:hypothetical protein